jgi:hypothetical protein
MCDPATRHPHCCLNHLAKAEAVGVVVRNTGLELCFLGSDPSSLTMCDLWQAC